MKSMSHTHAEHERTQLATQFDHWRRQRTTRAERIPHALWEQAVALATVLPLSRVAKRLRVSWSDLHTHWAAHHATTAVDASPAALRFVAVTAPSPWPFQPVGTEVALHRADGACLRICAREAPLPLAALVRIFLETTACSSGPRKAAFFWRPRRSISAKALMALPRCAERRAPKTR